MKTIQKIHPAYILIAVILLFFGRNVIPSGGNFMGGIDVAEYFFWHAMFIKQQILSGTIPLWNPHYYSGHPFLANPQTFVMYPSTLLYVVFSLPWAFNLDTIIHIFLAALGSYSLVRLITDSRKAGLASGIIFSFSGYFMDNLFAGHLTMIHTAAILPWIFYFIEKGIRDRKTIYFLISGAVLGLQILSGEPQNNYYTAVFLTVYFFIIIASSYKNSGLMKVSQWLFLYMIVPVTVFGISAIQILPSLEFMLNSDRAKNTYEFVTFMSFPFRNFFTFVVPKVESSLINTNWEYSGYVGIFSLFLAFFGCLYHKNRRYVWCFLAMILFAVTIMVGNNTPLFILYYKFVPDISTFRIPARCIVIVVFSLSVLAGLGVDNLLKVPLTKKKHYSTLGSIIVLFAILLGGAQYFQVPLTSREIITAIGLIIGIAVVYGTLILQKEKNIAAILIIALLFMDAFLVYSYQTPKLNSNKLLQKQRYEKIYENDPGLYRINIPFGTLRGMGFNYQGINGYTPIVLGDYYRFVHAMANVPVPLKRRHTLSPQLFTADLAFSSKILGVKYAFAKVQNGYQMFIARQVMPRAVLVREAIVLPVEEHIQYIKNPDFDPQKQVLLEKATINELSFTLVEENNSKKDDIVKITKYYPNRIELKSDSDNNTYLLLSELYYPGWKAYVDGNDVPILRADYILRAIPLSSGQHDIVFVYRPFSFVCGAVISLITFSILLMLLIILPIFMRNKANI